MLRILQTSLNISMKYGGIPRLTQSRTENNSLHRQLATPRISRLKRLSPDRGTFSLMKLLHYMTISFTLLRFKTSLMSGTHASSFIKTTKLLSAHLWSCLPVLPSHGLRRWRRPSARRIILPLSGKFQMQALIQSDKQRRGLVAVTS